MLTILEIENNFCDCLIRLFILLGYTINIIKIIVPIIIILMGSIDFVKAVVAQKDDEIKKTKDIFIKRLIYGIVVFFVISIVAFLIGLVGGDTNNRCFQCVADVNGEVCNKDNIPTCRKAKEEVEKKEEKEPTKDETPPVIEEKPEENEEPDLSGWSCSDVVQSPIDGCRVHFSNFFIGQNQQIFSLENTLGNDNEILGTGKYLNSNDVLINSYTLHQDGLKREQKSLDSIAIDKNTKLIYYKNKNLEGEFYEKEGPLLLYSMDILYGTGKSLDQIDGSKKIFNGTTFRVEVSKIPFNDASGGVNLDSFIICCKN